MAASNHEGPVLFAYNGSDHAKAAIRRAGQQLQTNRRAIVLTVFEPPAAQPFAPSPAAAPSALDEGLAFEEGLELEPSRLAALEESLELEARSMAEEGAELARASGFDAEPSVEPGETVWRRIVDSAEEHDAAVVVVGSRGRTRLGRLLMGSIAEATARHSDRPVLTVHEPTSARGDAG